MDELKWELRAKDGTVVGVGTGLMSDNLLITPADPPSDKPGHYLCIDGVPIVELRVAVILKNKGDTLTFNMNMTVEYDPNEFGS